MFIQLANIIKESTVDGTGIRYVVFMQGCYHNCPGCQNMETHDVNGGMRVDIQDILSDIEKLNTRWYSGITLSGGDPLVQPKQATVLAKAAHERGLNVWCYTGYTFEEVMEMTKVNSDVWELLNSIDVLVDGQFIQAQASLELKFKGSSNQRLIDVPKTLQTGNIVEFDVG